MFGNAIAPIVDSSARMLLPTETSQAKQLKNIWRFVPIPRCKDGNWLTEYSGRFPGLWTRKVAAPVNNKIHRAEPVVRTLSNVEF